MLYSNIYKSLKTVVSQKFATSQTPAIAASKPAFPCFSSPLPASSPHPKYSGHGYSNCYLTCDLSVQVASLKGLMNSFVCFALKVLPKLDYRRTTFCVENPLRHR